MTILNFGTCNLVAERKTYKVHDLEGGAHWTRILSFDTFVQVQELAENENPWTIFVETLEIDSNKKKLPPFDKESEYCAEELFWGFGVSLRRTATEQDWRGVLKRVLLGAGDVLLFLKRYDPKSKSISYCGHVYMPITDKLSESFS